MKKFIIALFISIFTLPVLAVCSITGGAACTASGSYLDSQSLRDRHVPDNVKELQKTDAFTPQYVTPYHNMLINTEESVPTGPASPNYNSNCQFGVCLPSGTPEGIPGID